MENYAFLILEVKVTDRRTTDKLYYRLILFDGWFLLRFWNALRPKLNALKQYAGKLILLFILYGKKMFSPLQNKNRKSLFPLVIVYLFY